MSHWLALQPVWVSAPVRSESGEASVVDPALALAWCALQFSPKVAWADMGELHGAGTAMGKAAGAAVDGGAGDEAARRVLVLEVSASERLFGGRRRLLQQVSAAIEPLASMERGQGATSLVAIGRLLARTLGAAPDCPADDLPLLALMAARPHVPTLERLGCQTWGQLRALPRGGVSRRFGAALLAALDCAYGLRPESYRWLELPEVFEQPLELPSHVESAGALMFGARRLLAQLQVWLQARQRGVLGLELAWQMDRRRDTAVQGQVQIRTAEPTLDVSHLQRLLAEHLERITLPSPAVGLVLRTLETAPLAGGTASLLPDEVRKGDSWHQMVERLSARLGPQQVRQLQPGDDHRPERMQHWVSATSALPQRKQVAPDSIALCRTSIGSAALKHSKFDALYPTWLLAVPLRLAMRGGVPLYQGPLTLVVGPQRLETGWWQGDSPALPGEAPAVLALRDYFIARSEFAGVLWVYRERLPLPYSPADAAVGADGGAGARQASARMVLRWYLHGVFA